MAVILLHVGHHYATKLRPQNQSAFAGLLIYFMHLIHARNMEDIKQNIYSKYTLILPTHLQLHPQITSFQSYTYISHHPHPCTTSHQTYPLHLKVPVLFRATVQITKLSAQFLSGAAISSLLVLNVFFILPYSQKT